MEREKNIGFWDKKRMFLAKHKPGKSRHALTDATYEIEDVGPFAVDFSGAPVYKKTTALVSVILCFIIYWFWYGWVNEGFIDYMLLEQMTWWAFGGGMGVVIIIIAMLIDYHKGSFAQYKRILEMRLRSLDRKPLKRAEFKIRNSIELYNPATGAYWRDHLEDIEGEEVEKEAKAVSSEIEELMRTNPEMKKMLDSKELKLASLKAELALFHEKFKPVDTKDEDMPFFVLEGKRFSSVRAMKEIADMTLAKGEVVSTKDEPKKALNAVRELLELMEKIRLPFHVTLCDCDSKGGQLYPLFISEHSLFGGSSGKGSFVEFREHTLAQRTWAGIVSKDNVRAGVGEGIELAMYKFYKLIPDEFTLVGKKEEKIVFAPMIFVTASDAQAEKMMDNFRYNTTRKGPVQQDVIDASVLYSSSVADELLETNKLIVSQLDRKTKSEKELRQDMEWEIKDGIFKGLEKALIVERAGKGGIFRNINLFSRQSVKYLFYTVAIIAIVFLALYILNYYGGINLGWLFPDSGGNETVADDPWGNIIQPLWEWTK